MVSGERGCKNFKTKDMTKAEFLKKWVPEAEKITHIIGINYMLRAMGDDLDDLVHSAMEGENEKRPDELWVATAELRWAHGDGTMFLEQKWTRKEFIGRYVQDSVEWRKVPIEQI